MARQINGILGGISGSVNELTFKTRNSKSLVGLKGSVGNLDINEGQESTRLWVNNLQISYNSLLLNWKNNIFAYVDGVPQIKANALLRVVNYARNSPSGITPCESLFSNSYVFASRFGLSLNSFNNFLTYRVDNFNQSLKNQATNGVLWLALGINGVAKIDVGSANLTNTRTYTQNLSPISNCSLFYVQSILTDFPTSQVIVSRAYIVRKY
jgi:hypothetical protein